MTTISLVIPAFQAAGVLGAALGSVAMQTRRPDEVIVVDDGSTDATAAVAESWQDRLPLQVVRLPENLGGGVGAGAPRNVGVAASSGDTVALLDADDVLLPDHFAVLLDCYERHGGLVAANYLLWWPGQEMDLTPGNVLVPVPEPDEQWHHMLRENVIFVSTLFSRDLFDAAGGFRSISCEDWDLWIRMLEHGARIHMPEQVTALYRQSATSLSAGNRLVGGDISLLTELAERLHGEDLRIVRRSLRRRRARQHFLRGVDAHDAGDQGAARRSWLRALLTDPSLHRTGSHLDSVVALRALACLIAPEPALRLRAKRIRSGSVDLG